ncbi:MAG: alpha/beta fold hydrolase [Desulfobacterales bacterium]|nr:MAG: alpha/beta fold hydrolase [Desulfobacterales bacterium]UCD89254.1 MAG: alpha/beta fold hydrolase [Desulfobacterales bacterium]
MSKPKLDTVIKKITFSSDGYTLRGELHLPTTETPPVVIGSHGLFSTRNSPKQIELAKECNRWGIAFFRFDHRGCGQSNGNFNTVTSLEARCNDLMSAIKTIQQRSDIGDKVGLFGSSMGGSVCISVASELNIDALVTVAAPVLGYTIIDGLRKPNDSNELAISLTKKSHLSDITGKLSLLHHILIFHGDSDELIPPSNALEIYDKAGDPKKLIMQSNGDHRMSHSKHQEAFIKEAVLWFKNCFEGSLKRTAKKCS